MGTIIDSPRSSLEKLADLAKESFLGIKNTLGKNETGSLTNLISGFLQQKNEREKRFLQIVDRGLTEKDQMGDIQYARTFMLFDYWYGATRKIFTEAGNHVKLFIDTEQTYDLADLYVTLIDLHDRKFEGDFNGRLNRLTDFFVNETDNIELIKKLRLRLQNRYYNPPLKKDYQARSYDEQQSIYEKIGCVISQLDSRLEKLRNEVETAFSYLTQ